MTEEAQVIQADRDAAAKLHLLRYGDPHQYGDILCGELDDDPSVQAFARHRIAVARETTERAAALAEEYAAADLALRDAARAKNVGTGALVHATEGLAGRFIAAALRRNEHMEG